MKQYLIIARSARALATSLKRAGHEVHCLDCFADVETKQLADSIQQLTYHDDGFDTQQVIEFTRICKTNYPNIEVITGNGAELNPELIERLSEFVSVIGINADIIRQLKDPEYFSRLLSGLSIKHPRSSLSGLDSLNKVLIKKKTGTGGTHIKWQQPGFKLQDGYYFQEYIGGKVLSAVFLADANRAEVVGLNLQLQTARFEDMPFMYLGAIGSDVSNFELLNRQQKTEIKDIVNVI
ncbi:MAG: ATP-grasp domain-containing protein, partial [Proteobacteria bacterium]|nr:ATP-grasp domain-containing protein [Pseudomonadota bacterium]